MKIILREQIDKVGKLGETVTVKDGFARNFLIPQGLAYPATDSFLNMIKGEVRRKEARDAKTKGAAEILAGEMENVTVTITATVGASDKMFGSVTSSNIAEKLHEAGFKIEKKQIQLNEPIKALGIYHVPIKLHTEIHVDVKVWVVKEDEEGINAANDEPLEAEPAVAETVEEEKVESSETKEAEPAVAETAEEEKVESPETEEVETSSKETKSE